MERFTGYDITGEAYIWGNEARVEKSAVEFSEPKIYIKDAANLLAAYEDIGLSPQDIRIIEQENDWLKKSLKAGRVIIDSREHCLKQAITCVCSDREQQYGSPEDNFSAIARLWSDYTGHGFTALDVAMMMALLKIARIRTGTGTGSADSFVDLAGYAACGCEIASKKKEA